MSPSGRSEPGGYDELYEEFDSPLMRQVRTEAYGEDIGQHSWVTAEELRQVIPLLDLTSSSRFLDLGCGPCGPLTFLIGRVGCHGTGADRSGPAIVAGRARAAALGLETLITLQECELNESTPLASASFDAAISLDVILHLRDRERMFREVARLLVRGGRFLFTDAGVIRGPVSDEEIRSRAAHGYTQFAPEGFNDGALERAGFRLLRREDRTASLLTTASGRLAARATHRAALERLEGSEAFERQQRYLETVIALSERGALSRMMYLAEWDGPSHPTQGEEHGC